MKQLDFGKRIADLRKKKSLTQKELVDRCNNNVRTIQRIEAGKVSPRSSTIRIIFETLDEDSQTVYNEDAPVVIDLNTKMEWENLFVLKRSTPKAILVEQLNEGFI